MLCDLDAYRKSAVEKLSPFMPEIKRCRTVFSQLERQWTWIALTGKINCNAIAATLFDFIFKTRDTFGRLRQDMNSLPWAGRKRRVLPRPVAW